MTEEHNLRIFENRVLRGNISRKKISVAVPSGRSLAGIAGSNPAGNMDVCVLWMLCVAQVSATGRSIIQSPTECGHVTVISCNNSHLHLR